VPLLSPNLGSGPLGLEKGAARNSDIRFGLANVLRLAQHDTTWEVARLPRRADRLDDVAI
jgi:hypothetical protein